MMKMISLDMFELRDFENAGIFENVGAGSLLNSLVKPIIKLLTDDIKPALVSSDMYGFLA